MSGAAHASQLQDSAAVVSETSSKLRTIPVSSVSITMECSALLTSATLPYVAVHLFFRCSDTVAPSLSPTENYGNCYRDRE